MAKSGSTRSGGAAGLAAVSLALALAGAGGGFILVRQAMALARAEATAKPEEIHAPVPPEFTGTSRVVTLVPVITTMATPGVWVRLEAALVYDNGDGPLPANTAPAITEDILALMRTLTVGHISGASGFLHLKEDIDARASLRTDGRVRDVLIQSLVYE